MFGVVRTDQYSWTSPVTVTTLAVAVALLAAFILVERSFAREPLIRLGLLANRSVAGANLFNLLVGAAMASAFYFVSLYLQRVLGAGPARTGIEFLPFALGVIAGSVLAVKLGYRLAPRTLLVIGGLLTATGFAWFGQISSDGAFATDVLGPSIVASVGFGLCLGPVVSTATARRRAQRDGHRRRPAQQLAPDRRRARTRRPGHRRARPRHPHPGLRTRSVPRSRAPARRRPDRPHRPADGGAAAGAVAGAGRGEAMNVQTPQDHDYDEARAVFAAHIDRRPALIARVGGPDDIARVIAHARETGSELAIRGGGHSPAGHGVSDGGVVIDLAALRSFALDPAGRTAWAGAGLTAGAFSVAAGRQGLATGFGDTGSVGIGGITLAGGIGFLVRKHGLTVDNLLAAEIVTADGRLRRVDARTEPELFWALRGGGGNFGVVTRLKYRLQPVDTVLGGLLILPATPELITGFVAQAEAAPDELSTIANVMLAPPLPFVPAELHGSPVLMAKMVHAGDVEAGRRAVAPFRALAEPVADLLRPMRYPELFADDGPSRLTAVARTMFAGSVGSRQAETILERIGQSSATLAACEIRVLGGAMARVPADATAFAHRQSPTMISAAAIYDPSTSERSEHAAWVRGLSAELDGGHCGAYAGLLADEGQERVHAAYPGATWDRLAAVKAIYDPDNLFRLNQNIPPAALRTTKEEAWRSNS